MTPTKRDPERIDDAAPELDDAWFARARPAAEMLPALVGPDAAAEMLKRRGRPRLEQPKRLVSLRLDADVIERFRADGKGWQSRINDILRREAGLAPAPHRTR